MSNEEFSLHAWEKEKLDALVADTKYKRAKFEGRAEGIEQGSKKEKE